MINTNQQYNLTVSLIDSNGNEFEIESENVLTLTITESILEVIPKLDMVISNAGTFFESIPLTDKIRMRVILESPMRTVENLKDDPNYINAVFVISNYYAISDPSENKYFLFKIAGYLAYPYVSIKFSSFRGSSDEVISSVANIAGLTSDIRAKGGESMSWIQNNNALNFLYHVNERAFIPGDGVFIYITLKNSIVYTSMYTELSKESKMNAVYKRFKDVAFQDDKYITYDGFNVTNNTSIYNNLMGYGYQYIYFDGVDNQVVDIREKEKQTYLYNRNKIIPSDAITNFEDYGLIADDNLQNTIFKGKIQNDYFRHLLFSNTVELNINNTSTVKLFDKISLNINSIITPNTISEPYSGDYVVGAITYSITRDIPYSKKVILCRGGMNNYKNVYAKDII